ncbi:hypothetical protein [Streptacidiphilus sp. PAMC 29251]
MQDRQALRDRAARRNGTTGRGAGRRRARALLRVTAALLKALALLAAAVFLFAFCYVGVQGFRTSLGQAGTPGQFTARTCHVEMTGPDDNTRSTRPALSRRQ